ncbi:MAG: V-type ATP synthase subunit E [Candidatus Micrarchaeaceae archaeon]
MSLTEIRAEIERDAKQQADSIIAEGRKEAELIIREATAKASEISKRQEEDTRQELAMLLLERSASAELAAREIELAARELALESEAGSIRKELALSIKADKASYKRIFSNAIKAATDVAPEHELTISASRSDAELLKDIGARIEYKDMPGGLVIQSVNRDLKIDATVEGIIERNMDYIRAALLRSMFYSEGKRISAARAARGSRHVRASGKRKSTTKPKSTARRRGKGK